MTQITDEELMSAMLENQIPEAPLDDKVEDKVEVNEPVQEEPVQEEPVQNEASQYIGKRLVHDVNTGRKYEDQEKDHTIAEKKGLSRVGQRIGENVEIRDGWIPVDRALLGERDTFYPEDWEFLIRPATVEAIRNWSTLDEENANSVDDVFNEILKSCLAIKTSTGPIPWGNINSWDRFFFILLIREYTFAHGERKISYNEPCPNCDNDVTFELNSQSLLYDFPDTEVMSSYDAENRYWIIDPNSYEVDYPQVIQLYLPTLEKDASIKTWLITKLQENRNYKIDQVFLRFLPWLAPKISKDATIAQKQIKQYELKFKSWDGDMFAFMDDVLRNVVVTPSNKLITNCPVCGEEVTSDIRFPNSIRDLFDANHRFKKFGKK